MKIRFAAGVALIAALLAPPLVAQEPAAATAGQPATPAAGRRLHRFH